MVLATPLLPGSHRGGGAHLGRQRLLEAPLQVLHVGRLGPRDERRAPLLRVGVGGRRGRGGGASRGPCSESTWRRCTRSDLLARRMMGGGGPCGWALPACATCWWRPEIRSKLARSATEYTSTTASAHWTERVTWSGKRRTTLLVI